jgi:hypothetical protein
MDMKIRVKQGLHSKTVHLSLCKQQGDYTSQVLKSRVEKHRCLGLFAVEVLFARKRGANNVLHVELVDAREDK